MRPVSRTVRLALLVAALGLAPALAPAAPPAEPAHAEPKCPLPLHECLERYSHMRDRPWLGAWLIVADTTTDARLIERVYAGGPAERAGLAPGDRLEAIGGKPPKTFFTGRAGWKNGDQVALTVRRGERTVELKWTYSTIPDDVLADLLGAHVVAGHMAYGDFGEVGSQPH